MYIAYDEAPKIIIETDNLILSDHAIKFEQGCTSHQLNSFELILILQQPQNNSNRMASRFSNFQQAMVADILSSQDEKNVQLLLKRKGRLKNNKSTDPIYSQLFIICEESANLKAIDRDAISKVIRSQRSNTKITENVKKVVSQTKSHPRRYTTSSYSVELPPIYRKFQSALLPSLDRKEGTKSGNFSMSVEYNNAKSAYKKSIGTERKQKRDLHPMTNHKRYLTLNSDEQLSKQQHLAFLKSKKKQLKSKVQNPKSQWKQIQILKLQTYFMKLKKTKKNLIGLQSKLEKMKQSTLRNCVPESEKVPTFIKSYKVTNPELDVDSLVRMEKFGILLEQSISLYFGEVQKGTKHGLGIFLCTNYKYQGRFADGEKQQGYEITANGYYKGKFKNNKRHGIGEYFWGNGETYSGEWKDGIKYGTGIWKSGKGDSYVGQWINGKVEGYGVHISATGQRYEGQFKQFLKWGKGQETFPNGDIYQGTYLNGNAHGKGKYTWKNKIIFQGNFENGYRSGKGTLTAKKYLKFTGNFKQDLPDGQGLLVLENGDNYVGMFEKGEKNGEGTLRLKSEQKILSGKWKNNKFLFSQ